MLSQVTREASRSSSQPSVSDGRTGRTMYRRSAVLSTTRTSTSGSSFSPNSSRTLRGSRMVRARYSRLLYLYQAGGAFPADCLPPASSSF